MRLNCEKFGILLRLGQIVFNPKNLPPHATDTCKVDTTMLNWTGIAAWKRIVFRLPGLQLDCDILGDLNQDRLNCKDIQTIVMMTVGLCKKRQRVDGPHVLLPHMRKQSVYFCCNVTNQRHNPHQLWHDCRKYAIQAKSGQVVSGFWTIVSIRQNLQKLVQRQRPFWRLRQNHHAHFLPFPRPR